MAPSLWVKPSEKLILLNANPYRGGKSSELDGVQQALLSIFPIAWSIFLPGLLLAVFPTAQVSVQMLGPQRSLSATSPPRGTPPSTPPPPSRQHTIADPLTLFCHLHGTSVKLLFFWFGFIVHPLGIQTSRGQGSHRHLVWQYPSFQDNTGS